MVRKSDVQWWLLEARRHPESAPQIIEELARRLIELDAENEKLRNEVLRMRRRPMPSSDSTEIAALQRRVEALSNLLLHQSTPGAALVLLGEGSAVAKLALRSALERAHEYGQGLSQQAALGFRSALLAQAADELLALTTHGRGLWLSLNDVPSLLPDGNWPTVEPGLKPEEQIAIAVAVGERPRFWTVVTRQGYVQRFVRVALEQKLARGEQLLQSPFRRDEPAAIAEGDRGDLFLVSRWGQALRFSQRLIEPQGSVAMHLEAGDAVIAALSLPSDCEVVVATASGYALRRDTAPVAARTRLSAPGRPLIQAHDVLALFSYSPHSQLLYLTFSGRLALASLSQLPPQDRAGKGTRLCDFSRDPAVAVVLVTEGT